MRSECGTPAAYMRHRRYGETPCADCKRGWREYYQRLREERRKQKRDRSTD